MAHNIKAFTFHWKVSGFALSEWEVYGDGDPYRIETRYACPLSDDYYRSIYNGTSADYERECIGSVGIVRKSHSTEILKPEVFDAFVCWLKSEHAQHKTEITKRYADRYQEAVCEATLKDWVELEQWFESLRRGHYELLTHTWLIDTDKPLPRFQVFSRVGRPEFTGTGNACWTWILRKVKDYDTVGAIARGDWTISPITEVTE